MTVFRRDLILEVISKVVTIQMFFRNRGDRPRPESILPRVWLRSNRGKQVNERNTKPIFSDGPSLVSGEIGGHGIRGVGHEISLDLARIKAKCNCLSTYRILVVRQYLNSRIGFVISIQSYCKIELLAFNKLPSDRRTDRLDHPAPTLRLFCQNYRLLE